MDSPYHIETKRLLLRPWKKSDEIPWINLNQDPEVRKYFERILTPEESLAFINRINESFKNFGYGYWAVEEKVSGAFIGAVGASYATFKSFFTPCIEIGWRIATQYQKKGYASEAAIHVITYLKKHHPDNPIYAFTSPLNKASEKVMINIGMKKIGTFEHPAVPEHHPLKTHILYQIP